MNSHNSVIWKKGSSFFCLIVVGILIFHANLFADYTSYHVADAKDDVQDIRLLHDYDGSTGLSVFALLENGTIAIYGSKDLGVNWTLQATMAENASAFDVSYHDPFDSSYDFDIAYISKTDSKVRIIQYDTSGSCMIKVPLNITTGFPLYTPVPCLDVSLDWPHLAVSQQLNDDFDVSMWRDSGKGNYVCQYTYGLGPDARGFTKPSVSGHWVSVVVKDDSVAPGNSFLTVAYPYKDGSWKGDPSRVIMAGWLHESSRNEIASYEDTWIAAWQDDNYGGIKQIYIQMHNFGELCDYVSMPPSNLEPFAVNANSEGQYLVVGDGSKIKLLESPIDDVVLSSSAVIDTGWSDISCLDVSSNFGTDDAEIVASRYTNIKFFVWAELTVSSPNGGESWQQGSNHNITWNSRGVAEVVPISVGGAVATPG